MKTGSTGMRIIMLLITYVVVKGLHYLAGFGYDPFEEGLVTWKFLIDVGSWVLVYGLVYLVAKKVGASRQI